MLLLWLGLFAFVFALIAIDLAVLHRHARHIPLYEALAMSLFWVSLGLAFSIFIYFAYANNWLQINASASLTGQQALLDYLTTYTIEKTLSFDNLFVMAIVFHHFRVPIIYQHRVLMWGVFGAIVLRSVIILAGVVILEHLVWMNYVFGLYLLLSSFKFISRYMQKHATRENALVKLARRFMHVEDDVNDGILVRRVSGRLIATPLLITLFLIESADFMLALDSVPAIMTITLDPFILISSNLFAILGLRSLYFVLASIQEQFHYVRLSMVLITLFLAGKMLLLHFYTINTMVALAVILALLSLGIVASLIDKRRGPILTTSPLADDLGRLYEITFTGLKRIIILIIGSSVVILGVVMIFTPGPAIVVIPVGLAILATEFVWARRLLRKMEHELVHYSKETLNFFRRKKKPDNASDTKDTQ